MPQKTIFQLNREKKMSQNKVSGPKHLMIIRKLIFEINTAQL